MNWFEAFFIALIIPTVLCDVNSQPHCRKFEPTCSHQLNRINVSRDDCSIRRIESNSAKCKNLVLSTGGSATLGHVVLHHYLYVGTNYTYHTTGLNVSFSQIKWTRLRIQYKDRTNETFNFCREFNLNPQKQFPVSTSLFYDCLWTVNHEDREFDFKYETYDARRKISAGRHYIFKVPRHYNMLPQKSLRERPVFMYIDISELPVMILYWEILSDVTEFEVAVYQDGRFVKSKKMFDPPNKFGQFAYSYDVGSTSSKIHFTVQVIDKKCNGKCDIFNSSVITIESVSNRPLLIGIVGSVVLLPVILYSLYIWKRYSLLTANAIPTVLLVYRRSLRSHTQAILAFAKYLRNYCHVNALIDELDIPLTKSKDPHAWYQDAFLQANVVLVVSSPPRTDSLEEGLYQKVDLLALRILSEKYCDPHNNQKLISLLLPYCSRDDIPVEAKNLRCYSFRKDWNELLWNIRYGLKSFWIPKIDYLCYQSQIPGGDTDLRRHGKFLLDALHIAEDDVRKRNFSQNKTIDDADFEEVPLREGLVYQYGDAPEVNELLSPSSLKDDEHDVDSDAHEVYSEFPGDLQTIDLLGKETGSEINESAGSAQNHHRIDLNTLVL